MVEPPRPWHKTRPSAEERFLRNPPHVWRSPEDPVQHYMAAGFVLEGRTPRVKAEITGEGYAALHAQSRHTPGRYVLRTVLPWTALALGAALPTFGLVRHYMYKSVEEQRPYITSEPNPDGSGTFPEARRKGGAMGTLGAKPMVHPETGETGWSGLPDGYIQNVVEGWRHGTERTRHR